MKNEVEVIKFLKANLGECCQELREYRNTGILPVGQIWEAMGISEEGVVNSILVLVEKLAVEALADDFEHIAMDTVIDGVMIPNVTVSVIGEDVIILFKDESLLSFTSPTTVDKVALAGIVNDELKELDWDKDFDYVFTHQEYRKAVMNVANRLLG